VTRLALDASALIYLVEGSTDGRERLTRRVGAVLATPTGQVVASRLARLECRVKPLRDANSALLDEYDAIFGAATELRARHGFKTPDAIHLASAIEAGAEAFLTGDASLAKCPDVSVEIYAP
jgi:predicted nucleic acid-binding protein